MTDIYDWINIKSLILNLCASVKAASQKCLYINSWTHVEYELQKVQVLFSENNNHWAESSGSNF